MSSVAYRVNRPRSERPESAKKKNGATSQWDKASPVLKSLVRKENKLNRRSEKALKKYGSLYRAGKEREAIRLYNKTLARSSSHSRQEDAVRDAAYELARKEGIRLKNGSGKVARGM